MRKKQLFDALPLVFYTLTSLIISLASGILFVVIAGSSLPLVVAIISCAVLCLLPAVFTKAYAVKLKKISKGLAASLAFLGYILSIWITLCFYVSHDYELSVYRYMKETTADVYYFGGYDEFSEDYSSAEEYMNEMQSAPASIVLEGMSDQKLESLSADELSEINSESLWDYFGFTDILGSSADEVEQSMLAASKMNAYEFTFEYRGLYAKTTMYLLRHPSLASTEFIDVSTDPNTSISVSIVAVFLAGQLFAMWITQMRFDVNNDGQIIYTEPIKKRKKAKKNTDEK